MEMIRLKNMLLGENLKYFLEKKSNLRIDLLTNVK